MGVTAYDGDSGKIKGATDNTLIGNVGDALKVSPSGVTTVSPEGKPTFLVQTFSTATANNKSMLSILNTSATKILKLREIRMVNDQSTAVTGTVTSFSLIRITGHSAGTALTPNPHDTSDTLAAGITARTGATVAGESATPLKQWKMSSDEWGVGPQDVESLDHALQSLNPIFFVRDGAIKPIVLRQNQGIHVKCTTNTTTGSFTIEFLFTEE